MFLICLTATVSGPLLRQVEAASDFGCALALIGETGDRLTEPDGGVGDDKGEMTLKANACHDLASADSLCYGQWIALDGLSRTVCVRAFLRFTLTHPSLRLAPWLPAGAGPRHAWLQLYLF
jgi:hypothetical protein